jgi:tRNA (guanine-N7-)-methyltransferase
MGEARSGRADQGRAELSALSEGLPGELAIKRRLVYGRHVGRGLTVLQEELLKAALPALKLDLSRPAPQPLTRLFADGIDDVWLEIGFGGGEHLAWQAANHPGVGIIGCEPFVPGVAALAKRLGEDGGASVRIHDDDARFALEWLPDTSIGRAFVLFPDPWPKKRHRKRRLLNKDVLSELARVMRPGAPLRFATDIADYGDMVEEHMAALTDFEPCPGLLDERPADWPVTRYEQKAVAAGRTSRFYAFARGPMQRPTP